MLIGISAHCCNAVFSCCCHTCVCRVSVSCDTVKHAIGIYRVVQLKWGQLTFLMVTFECIVTIFGTCKLHTTRSGVMQILSKFCHNKHLTREMAPLRINKKQQCCRVQMSTARPSCLICPPFSCMTVCRRRLTGWYCDQWTSVTVCVSHVDSKWHYIACS